MSLRNVSISSPTHIEAPPLGLRAWACRDSRYLLLDRQRQQRHIVVQPAATMCTQTVHQNVPQRLGAAGAILQERRQEFPVAKHFPAGILCLEQTVRTQHQAVPALQLDASLLETASVEFTQHRPALRKPHPG